MPLTGEAKKEYQKKWREENAEHLRDKKREWEKNNVEKISEWKKLYRSSEHGKAVRKAHADKYYAEMPLSARKTRILNSARQNARKKGREFSITVDDLVWNTVCPVLGIPLNYGKPSDGRNHSFDSPSIDRTDASKDYVKGNVVIMSWRANRIKTDASINELSKLISYLTKEENL